MSERFAVNSDFGWWVVDFDAQLSGRLRSGKSQLGAVTGVSLEKAKPSLVSAARAGKAVSQLLKDYFDGDLLALDRIPVYQPGTDFSVGVRVAMRDIKAGDWASYAELAAAVGSPGATRAVGTVCSSNKVPLIVPCHRVLRADGSLGNYYYGTHVKSALLRHEGVDA